MLIHLERPSVSYYTCIRYHIALGFDSSKHIFMMKPIAACLPPGFRGAGNIGLTENNLIMKT